MKKTRVLSIIEVPVTEIIRKIKSRPRQARALGKAVRKTYNQTGAVKAVKYTVLGLQSIFPLRNGICPTRQ